MAEVRKLKVVKAIVRPDRRTDYLEEWGRYVESIESLGGRAWLFEDQALTGRFMEFVEFTAGEGREGRLRAALASTSLRATCQRREGDDQLFREVKPRG